MNASSIAGTRLPNHVSHTAMNHSDLTINAYSRVASFVASICDLPDRKSTRLNSSH